jgi:hypothetical protein
MQADGIAPSGVGGILCADFELRNKAILDKK